MDQTPVLPYELRIAVTGHRSLPDAAGVEHAVADLLDRIERLLGSASSHPLGETSSPQSLRQTLLTRAAKGVRLFWRAVPVAPQRVPKERRTPIEWTVISPIARGADRIVARAVLRRPGARLQVVMPFAVDDYRLDFADSEDRAEFEELLKLDASPTALPGQYGRELVGDNHEQRAHKQNERNTGYLRVGQRVVEACEILIAIWNGEGAAGRGGTADIVDYALEQNRVVLWIDSNRPSDPVKVLTKDQQAALPKTPSGVAYRPFYREVRGLSESFHQQAAYNRDPGVDLEELERERDEILGRLAETAQRAGFPTEALERWVEHFLPHWLRADQLAIRYQSLYVRAAIGLYMLSALAVTCATAQVLFFPQLLWIISIEIFAMLMIPVLWGISRNEAWHEKWLHDRHLAERFRIAMFTSLLDIRPAAAQPLTVLPFYRSREAWMVSAAERLVRSHRQRNVGLVSLQSLKQFVSRAWIAEQAEWHEGNARRKHQTAALSHRFSLLLFGLTLLMALLHLLGVGHGSGHHAGAGEPWPSLLIASLAITLPAWGTVAHAVGILRDRERIAERSKRMHAILSAIASRAEQAETMDELRETVAHAAQVMEAESHEWWVSLGYRELVLPA